MNNYIYIPRDDKVNESDHIPCDDLFVELPEGDPFHIGQGYERQVATLIGCKECGGTNFNVGLGSYFTGIRCVHCKWELCIHDG